MVILASLLEGPIFILLFGVHLNFDYSISLLFWGANFWVEDGHS
jgi:hypothetical protein